MVAAVFLAEELSVRKGCVTFAAIPLDEVSFRRHAGPRSLAWPGNSVAVSGGLPDSAAHGANLLPRWALAFFTAVPHGFEEVEGVADVSGVAFLEEKVLEVDNGVGAPVLLSPRWWRCLEAVHLRFDLGWLGSGMMELAVLSTS